MASNGQITKTKRRRRDTKLLEKRQKRLKKVQSEQAQSLDKILS